MNLKFIFKILDKEEWNKAKKNGKFSGSSKDINDGFIHFSEEEQVKETLKKYYDKQENLILLKVHTLNLEHLVIVLLVGMVVQLKIELMQHLFV